MSIFVDNFLRLARKKKSILCVGLDPTFEHVPGSFGVGLGAMEDYLMKVVDIAAEKVPVVKFQYAYYAALGTDYIKMMIRLIEYAKSKGLLAILDAKRADIGATMERYGKEVFGEYVADACTFEPYLGSTFMPDKSSQSWMPWLDRGRMVISMILTSNPEGAWLQKQKLESGLYVYEYLAEGVKDWNYLVSERTNERGCVGGVVGATWPEEAISCRVHAGDDVFFLIPGYGAQGGGAEGAVRGLVNSNQELMGTVNSSRGITLDSWHDRKAGESKPGDPMEHVINAVITAIVDLNEALKARFGGNDPYDYVA